MSGLMNGAPYYAPPSRHQKCYASMLGAPEEQKKPSLAEFPGLVAKAIRAGLIYRPPQAQAQEVAATPKPALAPWQVINCAECGVRFERGKRTLLKCERCRIPMRDCGGCGKSFRPVDRKKACCSADCSRIKQVTAFKANYRAANKTPVQCAVCGEFKPPRQAGSGVAKTCSPVCADAYRKTRNAEIAAVAAAKRTNK